MAIPEFILNKLIVQNSLKTRNDGFSFIILNSFASAVITRFRIFVGGEKVPDEQISISPANGMQIHGSEVQPDHPMALPVGCEIKIEVDNFSHSGIIHIVAMTREVGEIEFTLSESGKHKKFDSLKPNPLLFFKRPHKARITVNPSKATVKSSPLLRGQFVEHLEKCVYGGIWTDDGSRLREDTLDLISQLNPPLIRYPGGNYASGYHWEDGIGPKEKRPRRHDAAWQSEESNQVGTDEFLAFCEMLHSEPLLVVNDGSGSPEEAAHWVEYCNSPAGTEWGGKRAANGHPQPYNVKYWGIGNEVWGSWQIGTTSAAEYVKRAKRFIKTMKAVDPQIKVIAVGNDPHTDFPEDPAALWNKTVLEGLGADIDYLSWHIYQPEKSGWKDSYDPLELFRAVCAASIDIENVIGRVERQIRQYANGHQVLQAVDEWNLWLPPREKNVSMHRVTYTMRDALYVSSALITFMKHGSTVGMANLAQLVNVLPLIQTDAAGAIATPIFYPFILFSQVHNEILTSVIDCEHFESQQIDQNMQAHSSVPYLDGIAAINENRDSVTLVLVNRYPLERLSISIDLGLSEDFKPAHTLEIKGKSPESFNTFQKPFNVRISDADHPKADGKDWKITLKPCSVYFVEFRK